MGQMLCAWGCLQIQPGLAEGRNYPHTGGKAPAESRATASGVTTLQRECIRGSHSRQPKQTLSDCSLQTQKVLAIFSDVCSSVPRLSFPLLPWSSSPSCSDGHFWFLIPFFFPLPLSSLRCINSPPIQFYDTIFQQTRQPYFKNGLVSEKK